MRLKLATLVLAATFVVSTGCGGSDDSTSADTKQDEADITALVSDINTVTKDKDAQGFCALMQPSGVTEVFNTQSQCVRETEKILEQSRETEPTLEIENISIDGDTATVELANDAGGAPVNLVKEGGKWYVPLTGATPATESDTSGE
ncbi:MAG: hypothetical protein ACSLFI_11075 [Solirubrobacterales bacterium]